MKKESFLVVVGIVVGVVLLFFVDWLNLPMPTGKGTEFQGGAKPFEPVPLYWQNLPLRFPDKTDLPCLESDSESGSSCEGNWVMKCVLTTHGRRWRALEYCPGKVDRFRECYPKVGCKSCRPGCRGNILFSCDNYGNIKPCQNCGKTRECNDMTKSCECRNTGLIGWLFFPPCEDPVQLSIEDCGRLHNQPPPSN